MRPPAEWPSALRPRVKVWLTGRRVEGALRAALAHGVEIEAVRSVGHDILEIELAAPMLLPLRRAVRGRARVRVRRRLGGPYLWRQMARRPGLCVGAVVFALGLWTLGSLVWQVRVEGVPAPLARRLLAAAQRQGIRPGVPRAGIQRDRAAGALEHTVHGISWAGVQMDGGLVIIRAVPAIEAGKGEPKGQRLVATRGGVVVALHLRQGTAEVAVGQRVAKGQVLVRGYAAPGGVYADGSTAKAHWVAPRASVTARWGAAGQASASRVQIEGTDRRTSIAWMVRVYGRTLSEGGPPPATVDQRREAVTQWRIRLWGIEWMAVKVERVTESTRQVRRLSRSATVAAALLGAERDMLRKTGGDVRVVSRKVQARWQGTTATVRVQAEVEGDIARPVGSAPGG